MKLIDASKFKKMMTATLVQSRWDGTPDEDVMAIEVAVSLINELLDCVPAVDAVPVVHARWACDEDLNTVCTGCGRSIPTFHCYNEETDEEWDEPIDKTPFCPNCGAKMDGKELEG